MSLFKVKDWDVPSQAGVVGSASQPSKKRKRPVNDTGKVQSAQINVEKLMRKVEKGAMLSRNERKKQQRNRQDEATRSMGVSDHSDAKSPGKKAPGEARTQKRNPKGETGSMNDSSNMKKPRPSIGMRQTGFGIPSSSHSKHVTIDAPSLEHKRKPAQSTEPSSRLTSLQANMKGSLDGARFRWINEILYTSGSADGRRLMQDDPKLYEEYHVGFRQQVCNWPSNPVNHYVSVLSSYPRGTVIADLGCGDAALARSLVPKGYCVLSFDLVSDGVYVLEADVCERIPLPGMEGSADDNQGQVVDVCVCALSLMSLDWISCIRETWRVLRLGGELKIAEVASRFTDLNKFITVITDLGFKLNAKDDSNTHFTLFDFQKIPRPPLSVKKWNDLQGKREVLQPCEYKRR